MFFLLLNMPHDLCPFKDPVLEQLLVTLTMTLWCPEETNPVCVQTP